MTSEKKGMFVRIDAAFLPAKADLITKAFSCKKKPSVTDKRGREENRLMYEYLLENCELGRHSLEGEMHYISRKVAKGRQGSLKVCCQP